MPRLSGPGLPPFGESHDRLPLTPRHVVDPDRFPAPTWEELTDVIRDRDHAYLAWLALQRSPAEFRVLASLAVQIYREVHALRPSPPAGPQVEPG
jgi:hypothetical protein